MSREFHDATLASMSPTAGLVIRTDVPKPLWEQVAWIHRDFLSLYLVRRGRATHVIDRQPFEVTRGDVYAMLPGQAHWFDRCDRLVLDTIHLSEHCFSPAEWRTLGRPVSGRWLHLTPAAHAQVAELWSELRDEWERATPEAILLVPGLFARLLVRLNRLRVGTQSAAPARQESVVSSAVRYLEEHFAEPLRIEQLAAQVFLSPDRFTDVFVEALGRTPRDYLKHLRLEHAKRLLTTTSEPVSRVGLLSGFADPAYFARVFRAATGQTPRDWRQRHKLA